MGEMKVEHILLFLVGAFLVYHMMGGCRCKKVEGFRYKHKHKHKHKREQLPPSLPISCDATTWGCCPDGKTPALSMTDDCFPKIVNRNGEAPTQYEMETYCPNSENSKTRACYDSDKRCEYTEFCRNKIKDDPHNGLGCIAELDPDSGETIRTKCRYCGFGNYPDCPTPPNINS